MSRHRESTCWHHCRKWWLWRSWDEPEIVLDLPEFTATENTSNSSFGVDYVEFAGRQISQDEFAHYSPMMKHCSWLNQQQMSKRTSLSQYCKLFRDLSSTLCRDSKTASTNAQERSTVQLDWWMPTCLWRGEKTKRIQQSISSFQCEVPNDCFNRCISWSTRGSPVRNPRCKRKTIAFPSRALQSNERAYSVGEREAFACISAY